MKFRKTRSFKVGMLGEDAFMLYLKLKGIHSFKNEINESCFVDKIMLNPKTGRLTFAEIKTKPVMQKCNFTGCDVRSYHHYVKISAANPDKDFLMFFLDPKYNTCHFLSIERMTELLGMSEGVHWIYTDHAKTIYGWSLESMTEIKEFTFTPEQQEEIFKNQDIKYDLKAAKQQELFDEMLRTFGGDEEE